MSQRAKGSDLRKEFSCQKLSLKLDGAVRGAAREPITCKRLVRQHSPVDMIYCLAFNNMVIS
jgi:hypothetical protein